MRRLNPFAPGQIRNCPRELQHPMEGPRAHAELIHRAAHERLARLVQLTVITDVRRIRPRLGRI